MPSLARSLMIASLATILAIFLAPAAAAQSDAAAPDLVLRLDGESPVHALDRGSYSLNVTNTGDATATGINVTLSLPPGASFIEGHRCEATSDTLVTCSIEDLPPGSWIGYTFSLRFAQEGNYTIEGHVLAEQADAAPADNVDTLVVEVRPARPNPAPTGLTCNAESGGNRIAWGVNDFVQEYRVYRAEGQGDAVLVWSGVEQSYFDADVQVGNVYRYEVAAAREHGESERAACELTAIPFFPSWGAGLVALAAAGVGYVTLRRRS